MSQSNTTTSLSMLRTASRKAYHSSLSLQPEADDSIHILVKLGNEAMHSDDNGKVQHVLGMIQTKYRLLAMGRQPVDDRLRQAEERLRTYLGINAVPAAAQHSLPPSSLLSDKNAYLVSGNRIGWGR